jgi:uncharacterized repeat protein (TIGR03803 family)
LQLLEVQSKDYWSAEVFVNIQKLLLTFAGVGLLGSLVVRPAQTQTLTVVYPFQGAGSSDGATPGGPLIHDQSGNVYGTTAYGGDPVCNCGTVFKVDVTGHETVLHRFTGGIDGSGPVGLVSDSRGNLYGTAANGGDLACNCGIVFKLDASSGNLVVLHRFGRGVDGQRPGGGVIRDSRGNLYGTTYTGGVSINCSGIGCGTVFRVDSNGHESVLYNFTGGADGAFPESALVQDASGNLYGTTLYGGNSCSDPLGCGTVFAVDLFGHETVLHRFTGGADGIYPYAGLVRDSNGDLYGTASGGGTTGNGTIFMLDADRKLNVLYTFEGGADGQYPYGELLRDSTGNLYGTTANGGVGNYSYGTVFKFNGEHTVLHSFTGADGAHPNGRLTTDPAGKVFGTAASGGAFGYGTLFLLTP